MKIKYQSQFDLLRELVIVGIIFVAICFGINSFTHNLELKRVHKLLEMEKVSKLEVMKIALENDRLNKEYISILLESRESLNVEIDRLINEIQELKGDKQLLKDIRRHWSER